MFSFMFFLSSILFVVRCFTGSMVDLDKVYLTWINFASMAYLSGTHTHICTRITIESNGMQYTLIDTDWAQLTSQQNFPWYFSFILPLPFFGACVRIYRYMLVFICIYCYVYDKTSGISMQPKNKCLQFTFEGDRSNMFWKVTATFSFYIYITYSGYKYIFKFILIPNAKHWLFHYIFTTTHMRILGKTID